MKTPREVLLCKHQNIAPKLDALREQFLADLSKRPAPNTPSGRVGSVSSEGFSWRELALVVRWHLAGLASIWMVIALLRVSGAAGESPVTAQHPVNLSSTVILVLKENRRQIREFGNASTSSAPPNLPAASPSRRSYLQIHWAYS